MNHFDDVNRIAAQHEYDWVLSEADATGTEREYAVSIIGRIDWHLSGGTSETALLGDALKDFREERNAVPYTLDWWLRAYNALSRAMGTNDDALEETVLTAILEGNLELAEAEARAAR